MTKHRLPLIFTALLACTPSDPSTKTSPQAQASPAPETKAETKTEEAQDPEQVKPAAGILLSPGQQLPALARADALPSDALQLFVTIDEVHFGGQVLAKYAGAESLAADSPAIAAVHAALAGALEAGPKGSLLIVGDARVPYPILAPILEAANRAGFDERALVVELEAGGFGALPIRASEPAPRIDAGGRLTIDPHVLMLEDGFTVAMWSPPSPVKAQLPLAKPEAGLGEPGRWDMAALEALLAQQLALFPDQRGINFVALGPIPLCAVVETLGVLRGPECVSSDEASCRFPEVILLPEFVPGTGQGFQERYAETSGEGLPRPNSLAGFGGGQATSQVRQPSEAKLSGSLDATLVHRIMRVHIDEIRACYETGLATNPKLAGKIEFEFDIDAAGTVSSTSSKVDTLGETSVSDCIMGAIKQWRFPKPPGGEKVAVSYSYEFSPAP